MTKTKMREENKQTDLAIEPFAKAMTKKYLIGQVDNAKNLKVIQVLETLNKEDRLLVVDWAERLVEEAVHTRLEGIVKELDKRLHEDHIYTKNVTKQDEKEDPLGSQYLLGKEGGYIHCLEDLKQIIKQQLINEDGK